MSDSCYHWTKLDGPGGAWLLVAGVSGLVRIGLPGDGRPPQGVRDDGALAHARRQIAEYFAGTRREFDLPLDPRGTAFDLATWDALRGIPHGQTISYAELARRVGRPTAVRAVGGANGRNPLPLVIPCHRVIASDGTLGGYAGGLPLKRMLLDLEGASRQAVIRA